MLATKRKRLKFWVEKYATAGGSPAANVLAYDLTLSEKFQISHAYTVMLPLKKVGITEIFRYYSIIVQMLWSGNFNV